MGIKRLPWKNCRFSFCVCYAKYYFNKNTDPENQTILLLFCRPTDPIVFAFFFAVLLVEQKIILVSPYFENLSKINCNFCIQKLKLYSFQVLTLSTLSIISIITVRCTLREKCRNTELFLVRIFLYSDQIFLYFPGKYGPEITSYLDTFQAVVEMNCAQSIS